MITVGVVDAGRTRDLRRSALRPELGPHDPLPGDELAGAVHLAATEDDGTVVCTCFIYPEPPPWQPVLAGAWHLRQMATAPALRGRGVGGLVLTASIEYVRGQGAPLLWCNARDSALSFYERHGFRIHGGPFRDERDVPHHRMLLELPG